MGISLWWVRLLTRELGKDLYGSFVTFMAVTRFAGLGEAGIGGAVSILLLPLNAQKRYEEMARFLDSARALMLGLALAFGGLVLVLSPWLPSWLKFQDLPGTGSLLALFALGAMGIATSIFGSYVNNVSYALGNVCWPILPTFFLLHLAFLGQFIAARSGSPLWVQYVPHLASMLAAVWFVRLGVKWTQPRLAAFWPLSRDRKIFRELFLSGFWVYLAGLGNLMFTTTSQLLVNAGFSPGAVPPYLVNYKLLELAYTLINAASFFASAKIVSRLHSTVAEQRAEGVELFTYLHKVQVLMGLVAATGYFVVNDGFVQWWLGAEFKVPVSIQAAFAANLVLAAAGDAVLRLVSLQSQKDLAFYARTAVLTGVLNLVLGLCAMKWGVLLGVAVATVPAQFALSWFNVRRLCAIHGWPAWPIYWRTLVLPLLSVGAMIALKLTWPGADLRDQAGQALALLAVLAVSFWFTGLRPSDLPREIRTLLALLRRDGNPPLEKPGGES